VLIRIDAANAASNTRSEVAQRVLLSTAISV
jgi:hypothetical protein